MMASKEDCEQVLGDIVDLIHACECDEDATIPTLRADLSEWNGGVDEFSKLTIDGIANRLGFPDGAIPFFNPTQDTLGTADPWSVEGLAAMAAPTAEPLTARWHQYVGVAKIFQNFWQGLNVLLMDDVGVGKTLQAVASIAVYQFYVVWAKESKSAYNKHFGTIQPKVRRMRY